MNHKPMVIISAIFVLLHAIMEISGLFFLFIPPGAYESPRFYLEWLNKNVALSILIGVSAGLIRLTTFIGLLKNKLWAGKMVIYMSIITYASAPLYLPFGAVDVILTTPPFILMTILLNRGKKLSDSYPDNP
ncbi:MAG: hypothetical protein OEZ36_05160 [Spirochaetota bacterium]|nr:hypothetical protein [Spirochaetota bacterium]